MSTVTKYQLFGPSAEMAFAVPAASAWLSSAQCVETGEHHLEVKSEVAEAVIITVRFFSLASCCTAAAIGVTGRSTMALTPSVSNQRRAMEEATSGLFCVSACTISILRPFTPPPKSATAISAARIEPGPAESAYGPDSSVNTPMRSGPAF